MPHLYTDRPQIWVALRGYEKMLRDRGQAVELRRASRPPRRECE
jgi:hypothetical protein